MWVFVWTLLSLQTVAQRTDSEAIYARTADAVLLVVVENADGKQVSQGSAFVVQGGWLVSNAHVVRGGQVFVKSGPFKVLCTVERLDESLDLALLKPSTPLDVPGLPLAESTPAGGTKVFAVGNPQGLERTISEGLIGGIRDMQGVALLQMSAPISPGSSGGPVINSSGEVVGVAVGSLRSGQNLNFAVPAADLKRMISSTASSSLSDYLRAATGVAAERQKVDYSQDETSAWQRLFRQETELLKSAFAVAASSDEYVRVSEAARETDSDLAFDAASRALETTKAPTLAHYLALARSGQWARFMRKDREAEVILKRALTAAERAVSMAPNAENVFLLADLQEDTGDHTTAYANFQKSLALRPAKPSQTLRALLRTSQALKKQAEAADWYKRLAASGEMTAYDRLTRADFLYQLNEYREAAALYETLAADETPLLGKQPYQLWNLAAFSRWASHDHDAALRNARQAIAAAVTHKGSERVVANANCIIAEVLNDRGVYAPAVDAARGAIAVMPDSGWAYTQLARGLNGAERWSEAEAAAKTALNLTDGSDGEPHFELGSAYFGQKKWSLAKASYEHAARLWPKNAAAAYNVAVSLYNDRFYRDSIFWYEETLRRDPSHAERAQILARIAELRRR